VPPHVALFSNISNRSIIAVGAIPLSPTSARRTLNDFMVSNWQPTALSPRMHFRAADLSCGRRSISHVDTRKALALRSVEQALVGRDELNRLIQLIL
jgi:hypothetical protein